MNFPSIHFYGDVESNTLRPLLWVNHQPRFVKRSRFANGEEALRYGYRLVARWERRQWYKEQLPPTSE